MNFNKYKPVFLLFFLKKVDLFNLIFYLLILFFKFLKNKILEDVFKVINIFLQYLLKFLDKMIHQFIFFFKFYHILCLTKIILKNFVAINFSIFPFSYLNTITFPFFYLVKYLFKFIGLDRFSYFTVINDSLSLKFFEYFLNFFEFILSFINSL